MLFGNSRGTPLVDASDTKVGTGVGVSSGIAVTLIVWEVGSGLGAAVCVGFAAPGLEPQAVSATSGSTPTDRSHRFLIVFMLFNKFRA